MFIAFDTSVISIETGENFARFSHFVSLNDAFFET